MEPLQEARGGGGVRTPPRPPTTFLADPTPLPAAPPRAGTAARGPGGHSPPPPSHTDNAVNCQRRVARRPPRPGPRPHAPEVLGPDHFGVVHHFALVGRDLQGGQHVVHAGQAGGGTGRHAVELPLQDVEARPPCHVGALERVRQCQLRTCFPCPPTTGLTNARRQGPLGSNTDY